MRDPGFPLSLKMNGHHVASHQNNVQGEKMTCMCVCVYTRVWKSSRLWTHLYVVNVNLMNEASLAISVTHERSPLQTTRI